ncbi:nicotinamide-nucleotide amidohydrolase family protein [Halomonas sp. DP8Y7-3]|uniref:CinA family protein n=1 Tax=Halomonas sp. DP8Y7-3 TaxID=2859079 RepID=UPI001C949470|nr:nicotinamide-nucleotide amidohydrolase family protein [Halomonas sp. DP8Y7-3]MBY5927864.1 nicotinamide-nucleotide amidohydrolase family protein [Halomonas sp. DP8Y7-3]
MTPAPEDIRVLSSRLGELCLKLQVQVTTAESCTGGGVATAITDIAGSSDYFETGYVTYSNAAKQRLLGVPLALLERHGAVSESVVEAMVVGACAESGASHGVAISGVAGPGGGSDHKPVGTVWFAFAADGVCVAERCHFAGNRDDVRRQAIAYALQGLIDRLS